MKTGVYRIRNIVNNDCYIGSAASRGFHKRWLDHQWSANKNIHHSIVFQRAWNKYGANAFIFEILLYCDPENCLMYEQIAMDYYEPKYNICKIAGSCLGVKRKYRKLTNQHRQNISHALKGRKLNESTKQQLREINTGKRHSKKSIQKMRRVHIGMMHSDITKLKLSKMRLGENNPYSKLSTINVALIKSLIKKNISTKNLAQQFGVNVRTIRDIKNKKNMDPHQLNVLVTTRFIPHNIGGSTGEQLAIGFRQAGHNCITYGNVYGKPHDFRGSKEVQSQDFDLAIVMECNDGMLGYQSLFNHHRLKNVPRLYWDFDVSYGPAFAFQRAAEYNPDAFLVGNKLWVDEFQKRFNKPSRLLPYACSPIIHRRKPEVLKQFTVGFVGSMTPERQSLLGNIKCLSGVFGEALIDATNGLYTMVHINQNACKGLIPGRPWETAGCGTCLLMDQDSYNDFREFLTPDLGDSVEFFSSELELRSKIQELEFPSLEKLKSIREAGQHLMEYMHANHSYKNRAETILQWAKTNGILTKTS